MTTERFNWRGAFENSGVELRPSQREQVYRAIERWNSDWSIDSDGYLIHRIEDEDGDGIWDYDYDDSHDLGCYFDSDFIEWMDTKFLGAKRSKKPVVIGKSTKLPIPGARP